MRHRIKTQNLSRFSSYYQATLKSLAQAMVKHQRIMTTRLKAKVAQGLVEKLVGWGKENDSLAARRNAYRYLCDHALVKRLFSEIAPMFKDRTGGYTRIIPYKRRRGDNAEIVFLEFSMLKEVVKLPRVEKKPAQEKTEKPAHTHAEESHPEKESHQKEAKKPVKKPLGGFRQIFKSSKKDSK